VPEGSLMFPSESSFPPTINLEIFTITAMLDRIIAIPVKTFDYLHRAVRFSDLGFIVIIVFVCSLCHIDSTVKIKHNSSESLVNRNFERFKVEDTFIEFIGRETTRNFNYDTSMGSISKAYDYFG